LLTAVEELTGARLSVEQSARLIHGPTEEELVVAALEQSMVRSYQRLRRFWKERDLPDLRTAAFLLALELVAESYRHHGIFP
jgi:glutamate dehydrogenase (NAD(P)+)